MFKLCEEFDEETIRRSFQPAKRELGKAALRRMTSCFGMKIEAGKSQTHMLGKGKMRVILLMTAEEPYSEAKNRAEGLERVKGIEPSYAAWEAAVLPLNYTRESLKNSDSFLERGKGFFRRGEKLIATGKRVFSEPRRFFCFHGSEVWPRPAPRGAGAEVDRVFRHKLGPACQEGSFCKAR